MHEVARIKSALEMLLIVAVLAAGTIVGAGLLGAYGAQIDSTPTVAAQQEDPHEGQPEHCSNAKTAPKSHRCECKKTSEEDGGAGCNVEDKGCKTYCRKEKCFCVHRGCTS